MTPSIRWMRMLVIPLVLGGWLTVEGQESAPRNQNPQRQSPQPEEPTEPAKPAIPQLAAPVDPKTYKIGAEDILKIYVWREQELSGIVTVRPDGFVTIPLVGEVQVVGLTPLDLGEKLKGEYAKLVNNPVVGVEVMSVRSRKYYITGQVGRPGQFALVVPVTVLEALTLAGGLNEFANKKDIVIMRGDKRLKFNWNDVLKGKKLEQNVYLENGDFVIVK